MNKLTVKIPLQNPTFDVTIIYAHDYSGGNSPLDYIQMVRSHSIFLRPEVERAYWNNLEKNRRAFAAEVSKTVGPVDLIADPPSKSVIHRPYLSALIDEYNLGWVYFLKDEDVQAKFENLARLREVIKGPRTPRNVEPRPLSECSSVLIVDDAFSEGNIASVVLERLFTAKLPTTATVTIACPLRAHG